MSSSRRKEKLRAGLDGLFSKPAAKKDAVSIDDAPSADTPTPKPASSAPDDTPPVVPAPAAADPAPEPEVVPAPAAVRKPSPRPVVAKANGTGDAGQAFGREEQVVVFTLGDEYYAVNIAVVESIIKMQEITAVPNPPPGVEGVINLRGKVLPVVCLRTRLDMPRVPPTKETRIVIMEIYDSVVGCVVDTVTEVLRIPEDRIESPSALIATLDTAFIQGIAKMDDRLITLMDVNKLLALQA